MSMIPDDCSLADITIPGTHDSLALFCDKTKGPDADKSNFFKKNPKFARMCTICQTMDLPNQFLAGIRLVDIRVRAQSDGSLAIHHGIYFQNKYFFQVIEDCKKYLKAHPTECIVMRFKQEGSNDAGAKSVPEIWKVHLATNPNLYYTQKATPKLGDVRGKIVIWDQASLGDGLSDGNEISVVENHYKVCNQERPGDLSRLAIGEAFDSSLVEGWVDVDEKCDFVEQGMNDAQTLRSKIAVTWASGGFPGDIAAVAAYTNARVIEVAKKNPKQKFGIVAMDYPGPEAVERLIRANNGIPGYKDYKVEIRTGQGSGAGTDSMIYLKLHGDKGSSTAISLNDKISGDAFENSNTDTLTINVADVGEISSISVVNSNSVGPGSAWELESVLVDDAYFPCNAVLDTGTPVRWLKKGTPAREYEIEIVTGTRSGAGTDSNIFLTIFGSKGQTKEVRINTYLSGDAFENGDTDKLSLKLRDVGNVTRMKVRSDGSYAGAGWDLNCIKVDGQTATFNRWIESGSLEATAVVK